MWLSTYVWKKYKLFEIAHIYPANPTKIEKELLKNEEILNDNVNHPDNLVCLCSKCHKKFDNPRTIDEYKKMVQLKKELINKNKEIIEWDKNTLESEISYIIDFLSKKEYTWNFSDIIEYDPKTLDNKSKDFPLRWFLYCEDSNQMLSWAWSQWKKAKFPYYVYPRKSPLYWKSINRDKLHNYFEEYLKSITPKEELIEAFEKALEYAIKNRKENVLDYKKNLEKESKLIDSKINNYLKRIWEAKSELLIENYEKQIEELSIEKSKISEKINDNSKFDWTPLKKKIKLIKNSFNIRKNSDLGNKKLLLKNIFPKWIPINKKKQVWTPTLSLIYQSFSIWESSISLMVDQPRFELGTNGLRVRCSTDWAIDP